MYIWCDCTLYVFSLLEIADPCYSSAEVSTACTVFMKFISTGEWSFHIGLVRLWRCLSPSNQQSCLEYKDWKFAFSCAMLWASFYRGGETSWIPEVFVRAAAFIWKKKKQNKADPFPFDFSPKAPISSIFAPDILPSGRIPLSDLSMYSISRYCFCFQNMGSREIPFIPLYYTGLIVPWIHK